MSIDFNLVRKQITSRGGSPGLFIDHIGKEDTNLFFLENEIVSGLCDHTHISFYKFLANELKKREIVTTQKSTHQKSQL